MRNEQDFGVSDVWDGDEWRGEINKGYEICLFRQRYAYKESHPSFGFHLYPADVNYMFIISKLTNLMVDWYLCSLRTNLSVVCL